jgi:cytoskeletal protein RodZ
MTSTGSIIREQRERHGRSMAEIAAELCVTQHYLRAIEEDDVAGIPGLFFYKSFAKQYAASLGIDERLIRPALEAIREPDSPLPRPEIRVPDTLVQASNRRYIPDISMGWSVIALVVVLFGCSGFYTWWKRIPERTTSPTSKAVVTTPLTTDARSPQPAPIMEISALASQTSVHTPDDVGGVVLKLSATERTWLSVSSGGKEIFAGTLQAAESKTLTGLERATMKVGNAGGIEVRWNGRMISPLGTRGQVLTIRLTPQDFEIVPPKQDL